MTSRLDALLASVLDLTDEAVVSVDDGQCIVFFNKSAEKMFGYPAEAIIGQSINLLIPLSSREAHRSQLSRFGQSPEISRKMGERGEISALRRDGSEFPAEASITKIGFRDATTFTVILRDISAQRDAAETLANKTRQLRR